MCVFSLSYLACTALAPYCQLPCPDLHCFFLYLIHGTILKKLLNIKCVFWFSLQLLSKTFLILRRTERGMIISVYRSSCKVPVIIVRFNETGIFYTDFRRILKYQISWKSIYWEPSCSMLTGGQTNMTKLNSCFSQFCESIKTLHYAYAVCHCETHDQQLLFSKTALTG